MKGPCPENDAVIRDFLQAALIDTWARVQTLQLDWKQLTHYTVSRLEMPCYIESICALTGIEGYNIKVQLDSGSTYYREAPALSSIIDSLFQTVDFHPWCQASIHDTYLACVPVDRALNEVADEVYFRYKLRLFESIL